MYLSEFGGFQMEAVVIVRMVGCIPSVSERHKKQSCDFKLAQVLLTRCKVLLLDGPCFMDALRSIILPILNIRLAQLLTRRRCRASLHGVCHTLYGSFLRLI
ncbi:hypothetical protein FOZ62_025928 [Perkinsus olseni]|uniref:Uncharacterized protein n=1 Tax=Perkinsus olseni TaxID=32597 RepID=A0A7J6Q5C1_PEROL|nr:hypothetical protein FOZ62_025928 [Perkinsus olseni]